MAIIKSGQKNVCDFRQTKDGLLVTRTNSNPPNLYYGNIISVLQQWMLSLSLGINYDFMPFQPFCVLFAIILQVVIQFRLTEL